ncbi:MAG: 1-(5-phosphoribosyl)-5-[(5-phosphoribosylamino)methylideneamino]imidazole-4-carboxamide isomerase [Candidatus Margulisiibacteriota bacterium]
MFEVIPAVDILDGKCVRLEQGKFSLVTVYDSDPVNVAKKWADKGATRIHVVDLDGAKTGIPKNLEIVKKILKAVNVAVQIGGGIRNIDLIEELLGLGANRIILGTSAINNPNTLSNFCPRFGDKLAISLDVLNGKVTTHGWKKTAFLDAITQAKEAVKLGARRFVYTDIKRDGMLTGPNFEGIKELVAACEVPVIASGGISSAGDVEKLKELYSIGVEGCIIGKALYEGTIKLEDVI